MSFGITAFVVSQVYAADQQRKGLHAQADALKLAQETDARKTAEAETGAQVAANAKLADAQRRRRASALGAGDPNAPTGALGGTPAPAAAAGQAVAARSSANSGTALGAGAPATAGVSTRGGSTSRGNAP